MGQKSNRAIFYHGKYKNLKKKASILKQDPNKQQQKKVQTNVYLFWHKHCKFSEKSSVKPQNDT